MIERGKRRYDKEEQGRIEKKRKERRARSGMPFIIGWMTSDTKVLIKNATPDRREVLPASTDFLSSRYDGLFKAS